MSGNTFHFHAITLNYQCCHFVSDKRRYCVYSRRIDEAPYHRSMVIRPFQCSYFIVLLIILKRIRYFLQQSFFISKCEDMISKIRKISEKTMLGTVDYNFLCPHWCPQPCLLVLLWKICLSKWNFSIFDCPKLNCAKSTA